MALAHDLPTLHTPVVDEQQVYTQAVYGLVDKIPNPCPPHTHTSLNTTRYNAGFVERSRLNNESIPPLLTERNWRAIRSGAYRGRKPLPSDYDESFHELMSRLAYRHPHPGPPRNRSGNMGGTWRHMKECNGYGVGSHMWIDGVVTLYDESRLNSQRPWQQHGELSSAGQMLQTSERQLAMKPSFLLPQRKPFQITPVSKTNWYSRNQPEPLPFVEGGPKERTTTGKYKGFYSLN